MPKAKLKQIVLSLEASVFKEFRKVLFREGTTPHELLGFIAELISLRDPDIEVILEKLKKRERSFVRKPKEMDADYLYQQIENNLKKDKE